MDSLQFYIKKNFCNLNDEIKILDKEQRIRKEIEDIEQTDAIKDLEIFFLQILKNKYVEKIDYLTQQELINEIHEEEQLNLHEVLTENIKAQNNAIKLLSNAAKYSNAANNNSRLSARRTDALNRFAQLEEFGEAVKRKFEDDGVKEKLRLLEAEVKKKQEIYEEFNIEFENIQKNHENILKDLDREIEIKTILIKSDEKAINEMEQEITNLDESLKELKKKNQAQEDEKNHLKAEIERLKNEKNLSPVKQMDLPRCLTPTLDDIPDFNALVNSLKAKTLGTSTSSSFNRFMNNLEVAKNQKLTCLQEDNNTAFDSPHLPLPVSDSLSRPLPFSCKKIVQDMKEIQIGKNEKATDHGSDYSNNNSGLPLLPTLTEKNSSIIEQKTQRKIQILANVRIKSPLSIIQKNNKNLDVNKQQLPLPSDHHKDDKSAMVRDKISKLAIKRKVTGNKSIAESPITKKKIKNTEPTVQSTSCENLLNHEESFGSNSKTISLEQNINEKLQSVEDDEEENTNDGVNFDDLFAAFTVPAEEQQNYGVGILATDMEGDDDLNMNFDDEDDRNMDKKDGSGTGDQSDFFDHDDQNNKDYEDNSIFTV